LVEAPLEAEQVTELHERQRRGGRTWGGPFEDVARALSCSDGRLELPEFLLAGRDDLASGEQLRGEAGAVLKVSNRCGGVAQRVLAPARRGMTSSESLAVAAPATGHGRVHGVDWVVSVSAGAASARCGLRRRERWLEWR
jgi:hypothetical protein